jgi:flagellar biosynthetic protein FlhB
MSDAERSLEPTERRRQQAKEDGRVPRSSAASSGIIIVGCLAVLMTSGPRAMEMIGKQLRQHLGAQASLSTSQEQIVSEWQHVLFDVLSALAPLLAGFFVVAVLANFVQTGFLFIPKNVAPQLDRLNPLNGVRRIFSSANFVSVLLGLAQVVVAVMVAWWCLRTDFEKIVRLGELRPPEMLRSAGTILFSAAMKVGLGLFAVAVLDYAYRRWNHERELRMTPEQVREELRMIEGNPQVASRRRQIRRVPTQE